MSSGLSAGWIQSCRSADGPDGHSPLLDNRRLDNGRLDGWLDRRLDKRRLGNGRLGNGLLGNGLLSNWLLDNRRILTGSYSVFSAVHTDSGTERVSLRNVLQIPVIIPFDFSDPTTQTSVRIACPMTELDLAFLVPPDGIPLVELLDRNLPQPPHAGVGAILAIHPALHDVAAVAVPRPLGVFLPSGLAAHLTHGPQRLLHVPSAVDVRSDPRVAKAAHHHVVFVVVADRDRRGEPGLGFPPAAPRDPRLAVQPVLAPGRGVAKRPSFHVAGVAQKPELVRQRPVGPARRQVAVHGRAGPSQRVVIVVAQRAENRLGDFAVVGGRVEHSLEKRLWSIIGTPLQPGQHALISHGFGKKSMGGEVFFFLQDREF